MLTLKNTEISGLARSIVCSGNAMTMGDINTMKTGVDLEKHIARATKLGQHKAGQAHDHYLAGIVVHVDIKYPLYWSPEAQRYHFFEIICSQSTMHRLSLGLAGDCFNKYVTQASIAQMEVLRQAYEADKSYENMMILRSNLPWGFEMWETVTTNYLQLKTMYAQRFNHRLKEDWGAFVDWCDTLTSFNELTGCTRDK